MVAEGAGDEDRGCGPDPAITRLLESVGAGDAGAAEDLLTAVYADLRRLAARRLAHEAPGQTLDATSLVHEAYLRLVGDGSSEWDGRGHFFAAAAEAMRRILVERARRRGRIKHGGGRRRVPLDDGVMGVEPAGAGDLLAIDDALRAFEEHHAEQAMLVKLRYFAGLTLEQAGEAMGISRATAARQWAFAKAWLFDRLRERESPDD